MMARAALGDFYGVGEVLLRAAPFILAGLATAIPAQVRLINVGGEGQIAIGALTTTFVAVALGDTFPAYITLPILFLAGGMGGALWAGVVGLAAHEDQCQRDNFQPLAQLCGGLAGCLFCAWHPQRPGLL